MACNWVKNNVSVTNQLLNAGRGRGRGRSSEVRLGKGIGSASFTTTNKNIPPLIKMKLVNEDDKKRDFHHNKQGKFGKFGGKFVPESLITCLTELEAEFNLVLNDSKFQEELKVALREFVGRETPLYYAERLTKYYKNREGKGPEIYIKREDLNHSGSHKMNNAIAQVMIAKRMGLNSVVAATGAGQHGIATAAACAKHGLECTIFMGSEDIKKQSSNVGLMKVMGGEVKCVEGRFKEASSEAIRQWLGRLERRYYLTGTAVGPHPCPEMVREFQSVIGRETRKQGMEKWGGKPEVVVGCIGSGSNALGMFSEFIEEEVRVIGVEAGGFGLDTGNHSATLCKGHVGVYHGALTLSFAR